MAEVMQTKILYDDRFGRYHNHFTEVKVVHQPLLGDYLKEVIPVDTDVIIHVVLHDSRDEDNKSYLSDVKEILNRPNVVPHIISPRSYYRFPECKVVQYYLELGEGMRNRVKKIGELVEGEPDKEKIHINVTQDINSIMLEYQTPSGKKM